MAPGAMAEAMRAYIRDQPVEPLSPSEPRADLMRLEKARKGIAGIATAIEDGDYVAPMERLKTLEADADAIELALNQAPLDVHNICLKDSNQARNAAIKWLEAQGFKAEKATTGKFGPNVGKPIGMQTADVKIGFRLEYDGRSDPRPPQCEASMFWRD